MRALACPASLKGVLTAAEAAAALAEGLRSAGADVVELPVADGGEGTAEALWLARGGEWREADVHDAFGTPHRARWLALPEGTAVVESAAAVPLDASRLDPLTASSRGFGELVRAALDDGPKGLVLGLGGTATMDAGSGFLEVIAALPVPAVAACDVTATLLDAPRLFGPQKGADQAAVAELERRFAAREELVSIRHKPGSGAAGGLGAALAALGAELVSGASYVLDAVGFDAASFDLVVTGRGSRRRDNLAWKGARRGRAPVCRDAMRRLRRRCRARRSGRRDRRAVGRPGEGAGRPRRCWDET